MDIKEAIGNIVSRIDLKEEEMQSVMRQIMTGGATPTQIGGFLAGILLLRFFPPAYRRQLHY